MYLEFTVINLYFALTISLQTSTTLLVVFMFHWASAVATGVAYDRECRCTLQVSYTQSCNGHEDPHPIDMRYKPEIYLP
jgi:hypothetical protein